MWLARIVFGAHGQLAVGIALFCVSVAAWTYGTLTIPHAAAAPGNWTPNIFIFHASMLALLIASYSIITTALGYRATERVEARVVENIEQADNVNVESSDSK
jgi:hypothetical protein